MSLVFGGSPVLGLRVATRPCRNPVNHRKPFARYSAPEGCASRTASPTEPTLARAQDGADLVSARNPNQLSSSGAVAFWAERIGVVFVTLVTLRAVYEFIKTSLPDLLDHTLPENLQVKINQVLARHYNYYDALKWCRSRQSGTNIEVFVGLGFAGDMNFAQVARIAKAVGDDIEASIPGCRATVTPVIAD